MAKEEIEVKIVLFEGDGQRDLRMEFPELAKIPEFAALKNKKEVMLCWLIGNRTSPIFNLDRKTKVRKAVETAYGAVAKTRKDLEGMYNYETDADLPDHILEGIERMKRFDPENRLKAKLLSQYMFDTLQEMVVVDRTTLATMDMDDKKKYADLLIKVNSELPEMLKVLESGFGVKTVDRKKGNKVLVNINSLGR